MCHIIIAAKKGGLGSELAESVIAGTYLAFERNPHMEGIYTSKEQKVHKSLPKMRLFDKKKEIAKSEIVIYHARFSTSGKGFNNCQPWIDNNRVMVHNGVFNIRNHSDANKSDSILVFDKLGSLLKAQKSFKDAFKESLDELTGSTNGSYSVGVYDPRTRTLDYTKNSSTGMEYYEFEGGFVMSTRSMYVFDNMFGRSKSLQTHKHYIARLDENFSLIDTGDEIRNEYQREAYSSVHGSRWWNGPYGGKTDTLWDDPRLIQPVGPCSTDDCTDKSFAGEIKWNSRYWNQRKAPNAYY